jgi:dolichol-phosphate mannosyltransferase
MSAPSRTPPEAPAAPPAAVPERGRTAELAGIAWGVVRRVHLGTRQPANWVQLFKFGIVGGSGYVINLVAFTLLVNGAGVHHIAAAVLSFCVAVSNNFLLNRAWTFRDARGGHAGFQAARFLVVSVGALGVNLLVLYGLVDVASVPAVAGQALAVAVAMPFNFIGNKLWTFGSNASGSRRR